MQISVEELDSLKRRVTVQVPAQDIEPKVKDRLLSLSRQLKIKGFRPGKVPFKVAKGMYGAQVREEILGEVLRNTLQEALLERELRPLGAPQLDLKDPKEGEDLEYSATFEVMPEFEIRGLDDLTVERPEAEVAATDVDGMIDTLRRQNIRWNTVERAAQQGDQVTVSFEGKIDGNDFPGNTGQDMSVVLGSGAMLKDFEDALVGLSAGGATDFELTFPADYPIKEVAEKTAHFTAQVSAVAESELPELDDAFVAKFEIKEGGVEALRKAVQDNMERELLERIKSNVKNQLLDGLLNANDIPVPQVMIDANIEQMARQLNLPEINEQNAEQLTKLKTELFTAQAQRQAALGIIVSQLVSKNDMKPDEARVRTHLESMASTYEEPAEVIRWYQQNPKALEGIRALALEDQVIDWLLERATVTDKPSSFAEIVQPKQGTTPDAGPESIE
ncbi:MAG: trigger factor [Candidatus Competibacteraceae bacterium]|jgi:trigger factor|nr:trigger factor [Candidatus Competibacteraceae bacterium]